MFDKALCDMVCLPRPQDTAQDVKLPPAGMKGWCSVHARSVYFCINAKQHAVGGMGRLQHSPLIH